MRKIICHFIKKYSLELTLHCLRLNYLKIVTIISVGHFPSQCMCTERSRLPSLFASAAGRTSCAAEQSEVNMVKSACSRKIRMHLLVCYSRLNTCGLPLLLWIHHARANFCCARMSEPIKLRKRPLSWKLISQDTSESPWTPEAMAGFHQATRPSGG